MKKIISIVAVLTFICCIMPAFAAGPSKDPNPAPKASSENTIIGKVVSVDKAKGTIEVTDQSTKANKTFTVKEKDLAKIKKGNLVKIVLEPGTIDKAGYVYATTPEKLKKLNAK
jgi:hypothetical protein